MRGVVSVSSSVLFFFFNDTATTEIYTLSLHDALPICPPSPAASPPRSPTSSPYRSTPRTASPRAPRTTPARPPLGSTAGGSRHWRGCAPTRHAGDSGASTLASCASCRRRRRIPPPGPSSPSAAAAARRTTGSSRSCSSSMLPTSALWNGSPRILSEDLQPPVEPLALLLRPGAVADAGAVVRRAARALLDLPEEPCGSWPSWLAGHQCPAAERLTAILDRYGGALLADAVGLGKSYVALAVALARRESFALAAPAVLAPQWRALLAQHNTAARIITHESLSARDYRLPPSPAPYRLLVVDEAHRFRNPDTRRYRALAKLVVGARVLLVTATPVHNRLADLFHLFRLFLRDHELAALGRASLRRLASSLAAFRASLTRHEAFLDLALAAAQEGRTLDARDFSRFCAVGDAGDTQLALFAILLEAGAGSARPDDLAVTRELRAIARAQEDPKADALAALLGQRPRKTIVFVEAAATVRHLLRCLRGRRVAGVVGETALFAGGPGGRAEALRAFAPLAVERRMGAKAAAQRAAGAAQVESPSGQVSGAAGLDWCDRLQSLAAHAEPPAAAGACAAVRGHEPAVVLVIRVGALVEALVVVGEATVADPLRATHLLEAAASASDAPLDRQAIEAAIRRAAALVRTRLAAVATARWRAGDRDRLARRLIPWVLAAGRRAARRRDVPELARLDGLVSRLALGMTAGEEQLLEELLGRRAALAIADVLAWHEPPPPPREPSQAPPVGPLAPVP